MAQPRTGRGWLCETDEVTDTRHWETRRGAGQVALTAVEFAGAADERPIRRHNLIAGVAADSLRADCCWVGLPVPAVRRVAPEPTVELSGAGLGGWYAGAEARGGSRWAGKEVR